jgi:hypothetical protein
VSSAFDESRNCGNDDRSTEYGQRPVNDPVEQKMGPGSESERSWGRFVTPVAVYNKDIILLSLLVLLNMRMPAK